MEDKKEKEYPLPKQIGGDILDSLIKGGLGAIPIYGSPAAELFNLIIRPPLEQRRDNFLEVLAIRLEELEKRYNGLIETLKENESFISNFLQAAPIAIKNHKTEIHEALINSALNSALPGAPEDSIQKMYLNFLDSFTEWHLKLMNFAHDSKTWPVEQRKIVEDRPNQTSPLYHYAFESFPSLKSNRELLYVVWGDLVSKKLVNLPNLDLPVSHEVFLSPMTTSFGQGFMKFITAPPV